MNRVYESFDQLVGGQINPAQLRLELAARSEFIILASKY